MVKRVHHRRRDGTILPMLAVCLIGLFGFIGLAVDLGMLAVSRTQSQNAADTASLAACRTLNTKPGSVNSNLANAVAAGKARVTSNRYMSQNFANAQISKIEAGQYLYDPTSEIFRVATWTDVTNNQSATPSGGGSWTAIKVTLAISQPTYFMRVFGVNGMPTGAKATAVFKPRDIAFVLDMTGSMAFSSVFNEGGQSMNPDDIIPLFGHYANAPTNSIRATANKANGSGEAISRNNYTITTPGGPPIVRNFYFDPSNVGSPATPAFPLTVVGGLPNLKNAFHRWSPPQSGGDSPPGSGYTPYVYDFAGYNAFHNGTEANPKGPTPAPASFGTMTDAGGNTYVGDRWRRADGSIDKVDTTWTGAKRAPINAAELLGYTYTSTTVGGVNVVRFRDPVWEQYGYDLDIPGYRAFRASSTTPSDPGAYGGNGGQLVQNADKFQGYSMGPGYWGKTFFIWPPDPRTPVGQPGDANYVPGDWRLRFFHRNDGSTWGVNYDTQGSTPAGGVNSSLLNTGSSTVLATGTANWRVDYPAVLKWIKSGPQVLPPNLRAGHVLYYTSIPDDVDTNTGSDEVKRDKRWWKAYIDHVLAYNRSTGDASAELYGVADSWSVSGGGRRVNTTTMETWTGPSGSWIGGDVRKPYMAYNDSPNRPRLHFWFGPLSMMDFMGTNRGHSNNWLPGTCNEAQCWQLKAGMNSVLDDVKNNHPNNYAGLVLFANSGYNSIRRPMGQKFESLKNALFYPKSLLDTIDAGGAAAITCEKRPYNDSFGSAGQGEIPNADGSTDPNTGLSYAFNLLSPSATLPTNPYGTTKGRRGAGKVVIFETDGVPNNWRTFSFVQAGYNSYYPNSTSNNSAPNGDATSIAQTIAVVNQMDVQMATTTGGNSGLSLPNAPVRVYPIAFGDLFDEVLAPSATFRPTALKFMADVAAAGNTGLAGASTIAPAQIITGPYQTRIDNLKTCMENIFQSGVGVTLVE
jgi:Flp pilus assembly protein TadG